ncbi:hypothetical protein QJS10_CPA01g01998 [Acorus calamus]|uniref:Uncharacterized protein n=1 Tax=Acorus calamus TaxID=4465 RepID=A0AAV9FF74_ACOCL|nr:hypothetical protein QJS10_CPA01g01998 [Acorus calamus]
MVFISDISVMSMRIGDKARREPHPNPLHLRWHHQRLHCGQQNRRHHQRPRRVALGVPKAVRDD